jgi:hypothetical protein
MPGIRPQGSQQRRFNNFTPRIWGTWYTALRSETELHYLPMRENLKWESTAVYSLRENGLHRRFIDVLPIKVTFPQMAEDGFAVRFGEGTIINKHTC